MNIYANHNMDLYIDDKNNITKKDDGIIENINLDKVSFNEEDKDDDIYGIFKDVYPKRNLKFNTKVRVVLVPCAKEYHDAGISQDLWWREIDLINFQRNFKTEILVISSLKNIYINSQDDLSKVKKIWYENLNLKSI